MLLQYRNAGCSFRRCVQRAAARASVFMADLDRIILVCFLEIQSASLRGVHLGAAALLAGVRAVVVDLASGNGGGQIHYTGPLPLRLGPSKKSSNGRSQAGY